MSFAAAVEHLHALGLELAPSTTAPRRKFELEHMRILARALGDPQTQFPSILIAGTNGKGSTAATLSSILRAAGLRTGLYTSPHLTRVTERIRVAPTPTELGEHLASGMQDSGSSKVARLGADPCSLFPTPCLTEISEETFARLYFQVDEAANRLVSAGQLPHHPSFFETLTALAFLYFAEQKIDIAVLEVGLGGRLDATNIVEPILSVITDIALDHQEYLGNTIAEIAREKAGILRPNGTLITLPQHPEANRAIGETAIALNVHAISATDYLPGRNFEPPQNSGINVVPPQTRHPERSLAHLRQTQSKDPEASYPAPIPSNVSATVPPPLPLNHYTLTLDNQPLHIRSPLSGQHQQRNIALAIAAAIELRNYFGNKSARSSQTRNQTSHKSTKTPALAPETPLEPRTSNLEPCTNLEPSSASIQNGIAQTSWPGRLEFLPPNLLLDVAHNPAGAWTLRAAIATLPEDQPRTLIFSCLRDKDLREMAQILFPLFDSSSLATTACHSEPQAKNPRISLVAPLPLQDTSNLEPRTSNLAPGALNLILTPINSPRAAALDDLIAAARALDIPAHPTQDPAEALALARSLTPANGLILATGSITCSEPSCGQTILA